MTFTSDTWLMSLLYITKSALIEHINLSKNVLRT